MTVIGMTVAVDGVVVGILEVVVNPDILGSASERMTAAQGVGLMDLQNDSDDEM